MTTVSITIANEGPEPLILQVEDWAYAYRLGKGEEIEIVAESEIDTPRFRLYDAAGVRYLHIDDSDEYFVICEGKRFHMKEVCPRRIC